MGEPGVSTSVRGAFFWYLYRRLGKWQWRAVMSAAVATVAGFVGVVYYTVTKQGASHGVEPPLFAKILFNAMIGGLAFLVAFALFFWLRSILQWIAAVVAIIVIGALVTSKIVGKDIDTTAVQDGAKSISTRSWSAGQSLLDALTMNWTGTISGGVGSFLGLRRPRS
jgi:hypothetical protein